MSRILCVFMIVFASVAMLPLLTYAAPTEHAFAAEVTKMMDIIIHSLYKTKEVFLRELIANASDALDKLRQVGLTDKALVEDWPLEIRIRADPQANTLTIQDTGIGMSKEEMITNLGTIARSGTKEFIEKFKESGAGSSQQIGQFGVGFYASFLAGDVVEVISKTANGEKHLWRCNIKTGTFSVDVCPPELDAVDPITRQGTKITIHLNAAATDSDDEEAVDYTQESLLKELVHRYSEFINFPIYLLTRKTLTEEVPLTESELESEKAKTEAETETKKDEEDVQVEDADKPAPEAPKTTKTVSRTEEQFVHVNDNKPIWTRDASDATAEEYVAFYKALTKDTQSPHDYVHFKVEGATTDFRGLVFIPKKPSFQLLSNDQPQDFLKLFVKRVYISNDFPDFPRYLSFIKAVVDVDDIPLNVSRETLQKTKVVQNIKKSVISKTLSLLNKMAAHNETAYLDFYGTYATHLKLGVISEQEDARKKEDLAGLLRFATSATLETGAAKQTSFDDYISRMKTNQTDIYFVSGTDANVLKRLPYVEALLKRGFEVLYMVDTYDEYTIQALPSYKEKTLKNVAKGGIKDLADDEDAKKAQEERFKPLTAYLLKLFAKRIDKVSISSMLDTSPMAIVANSFGWSPAMEKLMAANGGGAAADPMTKFFASQKKIMEINPSHPLMEGLLTHLETNSSSDNNNKEVDKAFESDIRLLYDAALLHSGYELKNPASFAHRVEDMIRAKYHVAPLSEESKKEALAAEDAESLTSSDNPMDAFMNMSNLMKESGLGGGDNDMPLDFADSAFDEPVAPSTEEPKAASTAAVDEEAPKEPVAESAPEKEEL